MKRRFGKHRFACQQRFVNTAGDTQRPIMILVMSISERDEKASIRDSFQDRENPYRLDRFFGPRTLPARRMKDCAP